MTTLPDATSSRNFSTCTPSFRPLFSFHRLLFLFWLHPSELYTFYKTLSKILILLWKFFLLCHPRHNLCNHGYTPGSPGQNLIHVVFLYATYGNIGILCSSQHSQGTQALQVRRHPPLYMFCKEDPLLYNQLASYRVFRLRWRMGGYPIIISSPQALLLFLWEDHPDLYVLRRPLPSLQYQCCRLR